MPTRYKNRSIPPVRSSSLMDISDIEPRGPKSSTTGNRESLCQWAQTTFHKKGLRP